MHASIQVELKNLVAFKKFIIPNKKHSDVETALKQMESVD